MQRTFSKLARKAQHAKEHAAKDDTKQAPVYGRHIKPETRLWLHIDVNGISQDMEVGKHVIMRRAHLPARDIRLLDPVLCYPSTILGRERAIVVNLDHIKSIITAQEVFLLDAHNPLVCPLVQDLRSRLPQTPTKQTSPNGSGPNYEREHGGEHEDEQSQERSDLGRGRPSQLLAQEPAELQLRRRPSKYRLPLWHGPRSLPFEFRALEACLESVCSRLDREANVLALDAHAALDALTSRVSPHTLENVRQIKNQLVIIFGRAQRVRDEIEQLLDDDGDMAEMYLTEKRQRQESASASTASAASSQRSSLHGDHSATGETPVDATASSYPEVTLEDTLRRLHDAKPSQAAGQAAPSAHLDLAVGEFRQARHSPASSPPRNEERHKQDHGHHLHQSKVLAAKIARDHCKMVSFHSDQTNKLSRISSASRATGANGRRHDVEQLEMLLEAYFVLIDGIVHRVASVKESVDDTEDYVKIRLDDHRNTLLKVNVVLTISCLVIGMFISVTGIFGMNINIPLFTEGTPRDFWMVVGISSAASIVLQASIMGWCKYTSLI